MAAMFLLLTLAVPAPDNPVPDKSAPGPPPQVMTVSLEKDGRPFIEVNRVEYRKEVRKVSENVNGAVVTRAIEVQVPVFLSVKTYLSDAGVQVIGADGKRIPAAQVAKLFPQPAAVLVSADGKAVDPFYLRLLREGGVCVIAPGLSAPNPLPAGTPMPPKSPPPVNDRNVP